MQVKNLQADILGGRKSFFTCCLINSSLKYFVTWMKAVSGIRLDFPASNDGRLGKWNIIYPSFVFAINCAFNFAMVIFGFKAIFASGNKSSAELEKFSDVKKFILIINICNVAIYEVGVHLSFLKSFFTNRWKNLLSCLAKIESQMHLTDQFYKQIRKAVIAGFLIAALVISVKIFKTRLTK